MSHRPRRPGLRLVLGLVPLLIAAAAGGQERERDETERWVPAFSIYAGVMLQDSDAFVGSGDIMADTVCAVTPPPDPPGQDCDAHPEVLGEAIRSSYTPSPSAADPTIIKPIGDQIDDDFMVTPYVIGSVEIMTPGLQDIPTRPRLFAHGDVGGSFGFTRGIAREGTPGELVVPEPIGGDSTFVQEVEGQGSKTSAEIEPLMVSAGVGVAFTLDWLGRRIRIKPSFEYLREDIEVKGVVNSAVALTPVRAGAPNPRGEGPTGTGDMRSAADDYRLISLTARDSKVYHGIGPGLEIEMDAVRAGPLMLTVYTSGQAYHFLGDMDIEMSAVNELGEEASWSFEKQRWGGRVGVGLRFRWLPE